MVRGAVMGIVENIRTKYGDYLYYRAMSIPEC